MRRTVAMVLALALASPACAASRSLRAAPSLPTDGTTLAILLSLVVIGVVANVATDHGDTRPPMLPLEPDPHDPAGAH